VTRDGDQLPYIDQIVMTEVADPQVGKIQIASGKVDISHAAFNQLTLADVSTLMKNREKAGIDVYLWDSGTGSAGAFFLNQDYYEERYRQLFREPKFRQALSMAFDREEAKKAIYFQRGKPTTGTMSPKAAEFGDEQGAAVYTAWRDAFVKHDTTAATALLDELGLKDSNGDGLREFPDGSKLHVQIALQADASDEFKAVTAQIVRDWKTVGIDGDVNPSPPAAFDDTWNAGRYMGHSNRSGGDGPNCLVYPQWIVPVEDNLWAPLQGQMYDTRGTKAYTSEADVDPWKRHPPRVMPEPGGPVDQLWKLYDATKIEPDMMKRNALVWEIAKVHTKYGPFFQGTVENPPQPVVVKNGLKNVPNRDNLFLGGFVSPWTHPSPAVYDPESFFWDEPADHAL
jgi:peptide/nickel transport system substrate-binding protein